MRILITSFVFLFATVEISEWLGNFKLPLPVLILGGACLAIASNYGKSPGWYFLQELPRFNTGQSPTPTLHGVTAKASTSHLNSSSTTLPPQTPPSVSFKIHPETHGKPELNTNISNKV